MQGTNTEDVPGSHTTTSKTPPQTRRMSEESIYEGVSDRSIARSPIHSPASEVSVWEERSRAQPRAHSKIRHTIGILLLLATVFLWTASNFLASTIFADDSYSKPYLVTYVNTSFFLLPLLPLLLKHAWDDRSNISTSVPIVSQLRNLLQRRVGRYKLLREHETPSTSSASSIASKPYERDAAAGLLSGDELLESHDVDIPTEVEGLTLSETVRLSLEFCILWFLANYFAAACLEYTTVASSTILSSTSSIWTLFIGALLRVERFTLRKFLGVMATLAGIVLISSVDVSGSTDENRGSFPHKTPHELAIGDAMAFFSAVLYGFYAVFMKKRIGDESRVNMPLFFGLVGLFNIILLWPGLFVLHFTGIEPFELPPTSRIFTIVIVNSAASLVSDFCWAYAMLLTSPLIVTVGLSLTIPLSLVGQMILDRQYSSGWYWVGAAITLLSFIFINHEEKKDEEEGTQSAGPSGSFQTIRADSIRSARSLDRRREDHSDGSPG